MVKKMKIEKKVELLNKFAGGSLGITHYVEWTLGSYFPNSFFSYGDGSNNREVYGKKFNDVVKKAYKKMQKEKKRIKKEKIKNG